MNAKKLGTSSAPAAAKKRERKTIVAVGFTKERLAQVDEAAQGEGLSRSAWLNLAAARLLASSSS